MAGSRVGESVDKQRAGTRGDGDEMILYGS